MTESRLPLTDVLAQVLAEGQQDLHRLRDEAAKIDARAATLPVHALEALLEHDDRFEATQGSWELTSDAPVAGVAGQSGPPQELPDEAQESQIDRIREFVVIDTETTSLDPYTAHLIEIAAVHVRDWAIVDSYSSLVYADEIPPGVAALTGIEHAHIVDAPHAAVAVDDLVAFAGDLPVLGQNIRFDLAVLQQVRASFAPPVVLELLELAHVALPQAVARSLVELAATLEVEASSAHRALADCETTLEVARRLVQLLDEELPRNHLIRQILARAENPWSALLAKADERSKSGDWISQLSAPWVADLTPTKPHSPSADEAFSPSGLILDRVPSAEIRPAQHEMAVETERALDEGERLLIEAPTGTGKSYAYLIPGLRTAIQQSKPVWVSTHTKALQTQLEQDFQRLRDLEIVDGHLAVLKGRENYLCTRDLLAAADTDLQSGSAVELAMLVSLLDEAQEGEIGEVTDFWLTNRYPGAADLRNTVRFNPATCEGQHCDFFGECPYFRARSRADSSPLVAVNHALLVTELAGDEHEDRIQELAGLVIDEAHTLEDAATSILAEEFDAQAISAWLNRLINANASSGLLRNVGRGFGLRVAETPTLAAALEVARRARKAVRVFAERMSLYLSEFVGTPAEGDYAVTHRFRIGVDDQRFLFLESRQALFVFAELTKELTEALWSLFQRTEGLTAGERYNGAALRRRLRAEAARGDQLVELGLTALALRDEEHVVYASWGHSDAEIPAVILTRAPIDVGPTLRSIYERSPTVIATSATLSVAGSFDFMRERLAADDFLAVELPHTFDYASQAGLLLTRHLPAPRANREQEFVSAVADTAVAAIGTARGGTLGLFTSKRRVAAAFELAEPGVRYEGLELRAQGPGTSTRELADWFRRTPAGSLFGVRTFWEGFDAPGDTLRLLLIEKAPFASPADPLVAARSERLEALGRDPFFDLAVPMAALAFKQGFGRLIRTKHDRGAVVVFDRRLRTGLSYQADFLNSLPAGLPIHFPADENEMLSVIAEVLGVTPRLDLARGVGPARSVADLSKTTIVDRNDPVQVTEALGAVLDLFGIQAFRDGQEKLIRALVEDKSDVVALMPTGAGKSLIFQAAAMCLEGVGIVVSPLVALMKDQVDSLRDDYGFRWAHALYGGQSGSERDEILDAVRGGGSRLLYVSPERLRDPNLMRALQNATISFVAVDEAHCVSVWGHDFRPDFLSIVPAIGGLPGSDAVPRLALTATAPDEVLDDILEQLQLRSPIVEKQSVDRPNLHFSVIRCNSRKEKRAQLLRAVLAHGELPGIVYCPTRNESEAAAALLRSQDIIARHYHAGMPAEQREAVQELFMSNEIQVICATNAFGLGVDKPDIGFVVHWALPFSLDSYFQEAGRAARDATMQGNAVLLWTKSDVNLINRLLTSTLPSIEDLEKLEAEVLALPWPYATAEELADRIGMDEISVRVGVHLLQRAGAIRQGLDVGARAFVAIPSSFERLLVRFGDETVARVRAIAEAAGMGPSSRSVIDLIHVSDALGISPADLERELLDLFDREVVGYRQVLRAMSLEHVSDDWDRAAVGRELERLRSASYRRLEAMVEYAKSKVCRRAQILEHFEETPEARCESCDVCTGEPAVFGSVSPARYADVEVVTEYTKQSIIGLIREASRLRSTPGKGSFVKALRGVRRYASYEIPTVLQRSRHFGSLRFMTETEIREAVDTLVAQGRISEVEHEMSNGHSFVGLDVRA